MLGSNPINECSKCGGTFITRESFRQVVADSEAGKTPDGWADDRREPRAGVAVSVYRGCPECSEPMNRVSFALGAAIVHHHCLRHGIWLDPGDLSRLLQFVSSGGLARAAVKKAARRREEKELERWARWFKAMIDNVRSGRYG